MDDYISQVIFELNKCEQFAHWKYDDVFAYIKEENLLENLEEFYRKGFSVQEAVERLDAITWCFM